jgi:predicted DNA binding CopG/RHH family protein
MKNIPEFKNETEESEFWLENDSTEYIDWQNAKSVSFNNLKPSAKSISIRLPEMLLSRLKQEANKLDIPYQSLMKLIINEGLERRQNARI